MNKTYLNENWLLKRIKTDFCIEDFSFLMKSGVISDFQANKEIDLDSYLPVPRIPCQVHDALLAHNLIRNPNITGQNQDLWIDENDWVYIHAFQTADFSGSWTLHFEGLDTFADIYLNGDKIGTNEDVYLPCVLSSLQLQKENFLVLHFKAPEAVLQQMDYPVGYEGKLQKTAMTRVFRSGFYDYNGPIPRLIRIGMYGGVYLEREEDCSISDIKVKTELLPPYKKASVLLDFTLKGTGVEKCLVQAILADEKGAEVSQCNCTGDSTIRIDVENPELWWPHTYGKPYIYTLIVYLHDAENRIIDQVQRNIGFRQIEMRGDMDFYVNGQSVRLWGANLAHPDTVTGCYQKERMEHLLRLSVLGHFNCLRIWGESEIYPDEFYDRCDALGILLWHDFYHAFSMYSEEPAFMELCRCEAEYLVKRLRHHPCILLWCGGNEMYLCRDYEHTGEPLLGEPIFTKIYKEVCETLDPERVYRTSSPVGGGFANDPLAGDTHGYTHLWFVPGVRYPVFASENCRVSAPPMRTMKRMMTSEELWPYKGWRMTKTNPLVWPETWSQHNTNQGHLKVGAIEQFYDADHAEELIYNLGAAHSLYIKKDVERFRQGRPDYISDSPRKTQGHLIWKMNNNSNIISYGVVDYFGEPLMAYYALKSAYAPILVSFSIEDFISVWLTNDTGAEITGTVVVKAYSLSKQDFTYEEQHKYSVNPDDSLKLGGFHLQNQLRRDHVLTAYVYDKNNILLNRNTAYLDIERHLIFPDEGNITAKIDGNCIVLESDVFVRSAELKGDEDGNPFGWIFSDNYFDIFPGEKKRVEIFGTHKKGKISIKPYYFKKEISFEWKI